MKLTAIFLRRSRGRTIPRALASLDGLAGEAVVLTHGSQADVDALERECRTLGVELLRHGISIGKGMIDSPFSYGDLIPEKNEKGGRLCTSAVVASNLSDVGNGLMGAARGDYVIVMNPGEVCLDPGNLGLTLDHLDAQPQIDVVACPVKIYSHSEHVRTVVAPKIFRIRRQATGDRQQSEPSALSPVTCRLTGVLADDFAPKVNTNWIQSASGLSFMDHGDAWDWDGASDLLDCKLLLHKWAGVDRPPSEDEAGLREWTTDLLRAGERLIRWNPAGARKVLGDVVEHGIPGVKGLALVALAKTWWRCHPDEADMGMALALADRAIAASSTRVEGYLERGFIRHAMGADDFKRDLEAGLTYSRGIPDMLFDDLRDKRLAELVVAASSRGKPCRESYDGRPESGCLYPDHPNEGKHLTLHRGRAVTWYDS